MPRMRSDDRFLGRLAARDVDDEACDEAAQIEAAVEPVGEGGEVVRGVLAVLQRVVRLGPPSSTPTAVSH